MEDALSTTTDIDEVQERIDLIVGTGTERTDNSTFAAHHRSRPEILPSGHRGHQGVVSQSGSSSALRESFPTADELIRAIPPAGLTSRQLTEIFLMRTLGRAREFGDLVMHHTAYDMRTGIFTVKSAHGSRRHEDANSSGKRRGAGAGAGAGVCGSAQRGIVATEYNSVGKYPEDTDSELEIVVQEWGKVKRRRKLRSETASEDH